MRCNRLVGLVILLAVLGMAVTGVAEAAPAGGPGVDGGTGAQSLLARILDAVQGFLGAVSSRFMAAEGATITGSG